MHRIFVKKQLKEFKKNFKSSIRFLPIESDYKIRFDKEEIRNEMKIETHDKIILLVWIFSSQGVVLSLSFCSPTVTKRYVGSSGVTGFVV